ncbi:MAG: hypothetical protein GQ559_12245 [Desulfobulbaceae bacterium]|nr:hypothetical protein [Desulfobulbaceae bacterium]
MMSETISPERRASDPVTWLEQYGDALYRFAYARVHNAFTAEDLVQETLLAAFRSQQQYDKRSLEKTWLTGHPQT